jgi:hypothetical protein
MVVTCHSLASFELKIAAVFRRPLRRQAIPFPKSTLSQSTVGDSP